MHTPQTHMWTKNQRQEEEFVYVAFRICIKLNNLINQKNCFCCFKYIQSKSNLAFSIGASLEQCSLHGSKDGRPSCNINLTGLL